MYLAAVKSDSDLAAMLGNRYDDTFRNGKTHSERVHLRCFWVRDNLKYAGEITGCECFRLFHMFAVLTLFPL